MSAAARPLSAERLAAGMSRPIGDWTDELITDGVRVIIAGLRAADDPGEELALRAALAAQGVTGADADTAVTRERRAYVASLTWALADLTCELGRRHPEMVIAEETWRGAMASALDTMIRRRRG